MLSKSPVDLKRQGKHDQLIMSSQDHASLGYVSRINLGQGGGDLRSTRIGVGFFMAIYRGFSSVIFVIGVRNYRLVITLGMKISIKGASL